MAEKKKRPRILTGSPLDLTFMGGRMPAVDLEGEMRSGRFEDAGSPANINKLQAYKRGGTVTRTGPAMLHKGEHVLTAAQARSILPPRQRSSSVTLPGGGKRRR